MDLKFKIVYKPRKENLTTDVLSRVAHMYPLQAVSVAQPQWVQEVLNSYMTDPKAQQLLQELAIVILMPRVLVSIRDSTERTTSFGLHTTQPCRPN
jgi:hypothetical protein